MSELKLNSPITEEQWDLITDVDFEHTNKITFHIKNGKEVDFIKASAQPNIKQAAKLLSDFIESCPGGDSYLITPNGEELRTDWGYAIEGIQLIHDWAERRTDG